MTVSFIVLYLNIYGHIANHGEYFSYNLLAAAIISNSYALLFWR